MDFLNSVKQYIEQKINLFGAPIEVGTLSAGNSVAIRPTPATPPTKYLTGGRNYTYQFQILVQHSENRLAHDTCQAIENLIDGLTNGAINSSDGSFVFNYSDVYTTTNWVERTNDGPIYTAIFQADLYIKKEE
ncbi:minor capsid protein [Thalassobacillus sp. C254]|uniref:phage tail terminator protein n=1 Tax=Thalassobacillus sp. C254 TaxID=1225341 RepID=UPI0006CF7B1E|nr:minor capsid protein [Thalassobacillus sp. C254]